MNCKPKNQDEQEIPFRLREIMRSRQEMKNPISNKKRKKEGNVQVHAGWQYSFVCPSPLRCLNVSRASGSRGPWTPSGLKVQELVEH